MALSTSRFVHSISICSEYEDIRHNHTGTAKRGRDPEFRLRRNGKPVELRDWAHQILHNVLAVAETIDRHEGDGSYAAAVGVLHKSVANPERTLSARIVTELEETGSSYFEFALEMAKCHRDYFASIAPLRAAQQQNLSAEAAESVLRQRQIEEADEISLDEYLQRYFTAC